MEHQPPVGKCAAVVVSQLQGTPSISYVYEISVS